MKEVCDLDRSKVNFGWCFDCVPEENSLLLEVGGVKFELPSQDLILSRSREVLGEAVEARFGKDAMIEDLRAAQRGEIIFDAEKYVNKIPAKKHDHYLIPGGTIHCSGAGSMVLEISATPNIFTFKLWDWQRLGLDGKPRPINVERGRQVIQWNRDTDYVYEHLANHFEPIAEGEGWSEVKTGLHPDEFIETRRGG